MDDGWKQAIPLLLDLKVWENPDNQPVGISGVPEGLRCIGVGTDAAVFQADDAPQYAFKVYAREKSEKLNVEESIYARLRGSQYFPVCFGSGETFLVISYEEGPTLLECLLQGIPIPEQVVKDVEAARDLVRRKGLNPRDIHLKNVLLQDGRAKILDVSEYIKNGDDRRWEYLTRAYQDYYHLIEGKKVPLWLAEAVRTWYHQAGDDFSYESFMKKITRYTKFYK
ncbi:serine/threonine protein kinase [Salimicrobium halophilum]|uniref:Serine/threonine protein kinase n=1 Tax=Salimicrobium halophilum TaxID=86666 RepID=A0A1G8RBS7_9BACI|nr:serine/threonine protein kinase [Salimicrobium halophilum]SDJ14437.1 hypothetical protein SAMN04490247_0943 [Salimicrobium halophilum]